MSIMKLVTEHLFLLLSLVHQSLLLIGNKIWHTEWCTVHNHPRYTNVILLLLVLIFTLAIAVHGYGSSGHSDRYCTCTVHIHCRIPWSEKRLR